MTPRRIRVAIVDLDGTLVDTLGDFDVALNLTLTELALPPVWRWPAPPTSRANLQWHCSTASTRLIWIGSAPPRMRKRGVTAPPRC